MEPCVEFMKEMYDSALVTFHTEAGRAVEFAQELSREWWYEEGDYYLILGVRWAAAMEDESTVIAAVRTRKGELEDWVAMTKKKYGRYGLNPNGNTVDQYFKDGRITPAAQDGMP